MKRLAIVLVLGILIYYGVMLRQAIIKGPISKVEVDAELVGIVDEWKSDMKLNNIRYDRFDRLYTVKIVNESQIDNNMAAADMWTHNIYISRTCILQGYWTTKAAIYHELGHYVFGFEHIDGPYIMNEYHHDNEDVKKNWEHLKEMYLIRCKKHETYAKL
ncbi:MAG: hypothetical protein ACFFKA_00075 [Candidatus Thorarchaeota archaeon]